MVKFDLRVCLSSKPKNRPEDLCTCFLRIETILFRGSSREDIPPPWNWVRIIINYTLHVYIKIARNKGYVYSAAQLCFAHSV